MTPEIQQLLAELYQLEPQLKNQEQELIKIINHMLKEKPQTRFDENFRNELRTRLLARAEELKKYQPVKVGLFGNVRFWQTVSVGAALAVVILLVALPFINKETQQSLLSPAITDFFNGELTFEKMADNAFGSLTVSQNALAPLPSPEAGFGGGGARTSASLATDQKIISGIMPVEPYVVYDYKFTYQGEDLKAVSDKVEVYKRLKENKQRFNDVFNRLNLGLIDTSKFSDLKIQYLNLIEDKDSGYLLDINPGEGIISLNLNWNTWQPDQTRESQSVGLSDFQNEAKFIDIADKFLTQYGINKDNYGQPEIDNQWRVYYEKEVNKADYYFPDTINVIYPLLINNQPVFEEYGNKVGLSVAINIRQEKVMSLYNLMTTNFQTSEYEAETNLEKIKDIALLGGLYNYPAAYDASAQVKTIDVVLGTPTLGLMRYWAYEGNQSTELFVPAYIFPILETKGEVNYYKQSIVVPVVKEILDVAGNVVIPQPRIEPLLTEEGTAEITVGPEGISAMDYETAKKVAEQSECLQEGSLKGEYFYNKNTKTWWFDLNIDKPGCNPACVVSEETQSAEINWRCTGLIPE